MRNGPRHQLLLYAQEKKRYRRTVRPNQQKNEKNMTTQLHNCLPPERSQIWSSEAKSPMSPRYNRKTWIDGLYHRGRSRMPLIMGHLLISSSSHPHWLVSGQVFISSPNQTITPMGPQPDCEICPVLVIVSDSPVGDSGRFNYIFFSSTTSYQHYIFPPFPC